MQYRYEAYSSTGQVLRGTLEAPTREQAEARLWQAELRVVSLARQREPLTLETLVPTLFGVKTQHVIDFTRQLSTLLESGIPLTQALAMLRNRVNKVTLRSIIDQVRQDLEQGISFSDACSRHPNFFPPLFLRLIRIGEETGSMEQMLRQTADYVEKEMNTVRRVRKSLNYPIVVLVISAGAIALLVNLVVPALSNLFKEFGSDLPIQTQILLNATSFLQVAGPYVAAAVGSGLGLGYVATRRPAGRLVWDRFLLGMPLLGAIVYYGTLARLGRTMAILLRSGLSTMDSLAILVSSPQNMVFAHALVRVQGAVIVGRSLSEAFGEEAIFDPLLRQMVSVGEESGRLEQNMDALALFYEGEMERAMAAMTGALEPALIMVAGGLVGFIAISIITPIYSVIGQIE